MECPKQRMAFEDLISEAYIRQDYIMISKSQRSAWQLSVHKGLDTMKSMLSDWTAEYTHWGQATVRLS